MSPVTYTGTQRAVRGHLPVLDGLRGLAILLVFVHNVGGPDGPASGVPFKIFDIATNIGWIGVQLFFVLSGFLITGILVDTKGKQNAWRAFYMRRVLRIFPLYYAMLLVAFVVMPLVLHRWTLTSKHAVFFLLYIQNWSPGLVVDQTAGKLSHFWSLAVEEQFYLVWPLVVFGLRKRTFVTIAIAMVVLSYVWRAVLLSTGTSVEWVYQGTFARMDALALGGLAAIALRDPAIFARWAPRLRVIAVGLALLLTALVVVSRGLPRTQHLVQTAGYTVLSLFFAAAILMLVQSTTRGGVLARVMSFEPLQALGKYSYGIYVFHIPIVVMLHEALHLDFTQGSPLHRIGLRVLFTTGSLLVVSLVAVTSYQLFEKRFLALKRHFQASPDEPTRSAT